MCDNGISNPISSKMIEDKVGYNSAYISMNLLDELDYYIGGYAKPNIEFLFSLNTFVESFIACSEFYTSLEELRHLNLTTSALFPNGRPMLNLIARECGLKYVNGIVERQGVEIYRSQVFQQQEREARRDFVLNYGNKILDRYFIISDVNKIVENIPLVNEKIDNDFFIVSEVQNTSEELVANLMAVSGSSSIQTTLPVYLYGRQINHLNRTPYSIQMLNDLSKLHETNLQELVKSLNYQFLPIPPFANILLEQVSSIAEFPQKLSQLRADFQVLRDQFIELEMEIIEASSLKIQLEAFNRFKEFWAAFNRKYNNKKHRIFYGGLDILNSGAIQDSAEKMVDGATFVEGIQEIKAIKIAANIGKKGLEWYRDKKIINRFKGLTDIWDLFNEGSGIGFQIKHFERLFGVHFSNSEINKVHGYVRNRLSEIQTRTI
jgi:hypothetical protein